LLDKGIHPQTITESYLQAAEKAQEIITEMSIPVDLSDEKQLLENASTSLNSKVVAQNSEALAQIAVSAVLKVIDPQTATAVDLSDIRVSKKVGGTVDDTELVDGLVLTQKVAKSAGGPTQVKNAKVGLIQFCLSPPKTDMESSIQVRDFQQMDRLLREERTIMARMVKAIAKTGCNVLLIQKSILRDAVTDLSLDFCAKAKILVVRDIEREDVEFIARIIGLEPVASLESFTAEKLGEAKLVHDEFLGEGQGNIVRFSGLNGTGRCVSVLVRASNSLLLDEAERSLHDALCVVRSLVKTRALIPGGGAPEMELALKLGMWSRTLSGVNALCIAHFADALEIIPYTLAENAGQSSVEAVTELRSAHREGQTFAGINVKKGGISDMKELKVVQPLLVTSSAIKMATETVQMILKIDDLVICR